MASQEVGNKFVGRRQTESIGEREEKDQYARQQHTGSEEERDQSSFLLRGLRAVNGFDDDGTGPAGGLGGRQEAQTKQDKWKTACGMWNRR